MQKKYFKKLLNRFIILLLLTFSIVKGQQNGSIYGFVTDSSSGEALIGANVFINDIGVGMATDVNGYYVLQNIKPGYYSIIVSYVGYELLEKKIVIIENESKKLDLVLLEEVVSLTEIEVTAEKIKRKNKGTYRKKNTQRQT